MSNEELLEEAKKAIDKLFGDMSVLKSETRTNLNDLIEYIEVMLDSLES